jgi:hypothetical protein
MKTVSMLVKIITLVLLSISFSYLFTQISYGQSVEKILTEPKFGLSLKYPSDWNFTTKLGEQNVGPPDFLFSTVFCPSQYDVCTLDSPVDFSINAYPLKQGTTLKQFHDQQIANMEEVKRLVGSPKNIETIKTNVSGLSAIQTTSTQSGSDGTDHNRLHIN